MSRLRRLVLSDRYFFLSCRVLPKRSRLTEHEFAILARAIQQRRQQHGFLLTAWVFLPDHWHAIIYPGFPLTISRVLEAIKVGATLRINRWRGERGVLLQGRFFDRALRTVREYHEKMEYIHLNPVKAGLVARPEDWKWSSVQDYTGTLQAPAGEGSPIPVDRIMLPADPRTRI
jgi:REP-associated tyrosine transposase